jgi:iron-sulfur cluster repair protein YtfE (RIC family)
MALTINLPQSTEQELRQDAASKGMSLDSYFLRLLKQAATPQSKNVSKLSSETDLLKKINLDISESEWVEYRRLIGLRRAEQLTEEAHQALIQLGNKIEDAHAKRMEHLWSLAQLRGVSLDKIMQDLGIKPIEV